MTDFACSVLAVARKIPPGRLVSYGRLAALAGWPGRARGVGFVMRSQTDTTVPCHRVVFADGRLAPEGTFQNQGGQLALLEKEGIGFLPDGRADIKKHLWP